MQGPTEGLPIGVPSTVRRVAGWAATALVVGAAGVLLLTLFVRNGLLDVLPFLAIPAFLILFATFPLTIVLSSQEGSRGSRRRGIPLRGWRRRAGTVLALVGVVMAFSKAGDLTGQPRETDGRYFVDSHGEATEVSEPEYRDVQAASLRFGAGIMLAMGSHVALYLTQAPGRGDEPPRPAGPFVRRLRGAPFEVRADGSLDEVGTRLAEVVPIVGERWASGHGASVMADWDVHVGWPGTPAPVRLDATLRDLGAGQVLVAGTVRPASASVVVGAVVSVVVGLGMAAGGVAFAVVVADVVGVLIGGGFALFVLYAAGTNAIAPREGPRAGRAQVQAALDRSGVAVVGPRGGRGAGTA